MALNNSIHRFYKVVIIFFLSTWMMKPNIFGQINQTQIFGNRDEIIVPFQFVNGFILVDITLQKVLKLKFILDTGAENTTLLKPIFANILGLANYKNLVIKGSDLQGEINAFVSNGVYIGLDQTISVRHNILVLETEQTYLDEFIGMTIDGILGMDFFKHLVLRIDYKKNQLTIIHPKKFKPSTLKNYESLDIEVIQNKPYIYATAEVNPGAPRKVKLLLDTGASLSALLHHNTDSMLLSKGEIFKGNLGRGLGGDIEGFVGKVHQLNLGSLHFDNLISNFQDLDSAMLVRDKIVRNGIIGNIILERFEVVFDFFHFKLYLKPSKKYNENFEFDKSGLIIFAFGNDFDKYYIKSVMQNSPASEADLRPGDIIKKINCMPASWMSLRSLNNKLSGKPGKILKIKINRQGQVLTKRIKLKNLFGAN